MASIKYWLLACMTAVAMTQFQGAALAQQAKAEAAAAASVDEEALHKKLIGTWELDYGGTLVTFAFTDADLSVMGMGATPYDLAGDQLSFEVMGNRSTVRLSFNSDNEMVFDGSEGKKLLKRLQ